MAWQGLRLSFAEVDDGGKVWEYAVLVTWLESEILSIGQLYRDRADCENVFDELKKTHGGRVASRLATSSAAV
jgi:hypothetical protein